MAARSDAPREVAVMVYYLDGNFTVQPADGLSDTVLDALCAKAAVDLRGSIERHGEIPRAEYAYTVRFEGGGFEIRPRTHPGVAQIVWIKRMLDGGRA